MKSVLETLAVVGIWTAAMAAVIWIMERVVMLCGILWSMRGVIG